MAPRVGLVLGAGGLVGQAYHAGVLAALEHHLGWDPRDADIIVGSSAGSVTGALLRTGMPSDDLAAWCVEARMSEIGTELREAMASAPDLPPFSPTDLLRPWRLPSPAMLRRAARRPWAVRPGAVLSSLMPPGRFDISGHLEALERVNADPWPARDLWISAVRRRDGRRVMFGRPGAPPARLHRAVAASCAIPGFFAPVRIGGADYLDGGAHSPTNADVLRGQRLDLVVVVSPMSMAGHHRALDARVRRLFHRRLREETALLGRAGTTVVCFEPSDELVDVLGPNAMDPDRSTDVVRETFLSTGARLLDERVARRLAPLTTQRSRVVA